MKKISIWMSVLMILPFLLSCSSPQGSLIAPAAAGSADKMPPVSSASPTTAVSSPSSSPAVIPPPDPEKAKMPEGLTILGESTVDISPKLSKTYFVNINLACEKLNGLRLLPGQTLSLKRAALPDKAEGYSGCRVISIADKFISMPQGVARVASTIYNVSLLADMTVVERHAGLWKAVYIPAGLDADFDITSNKDFQIRNDKDSPIWLQVVLDFDAGKLTARIYGSPWEKEQPVSLRSIVLEQIPAPEGDIIQTDVLVQSGTTYTLKARDGERVRVERVWRDKATGATRTEFLYEDYYLPFQETVYYHPGEEPND